VDLTLSPNDVEQLARTLDCLSNLTLATPLWRVDCARVVGALVEASTASLVVVTPAVRALSEAARTTGGRAPVERRRRAAGVWARGPATPGAGTSAIGMTARSSESDTVVSVVCDFEHALDPASTQRRLGYLRLAFPVFSATVARRFSRRADDASGHPLLSSSVRLLLDALPDGVACLDDDGQMVWRNRVLERQFAVDEEADRLRRELATTAQGLAIRAWGRRHGQVLEEEGAEIVGGEFRTQRGRYWLRLLRAEDGDDALVVAIVTRLGVAPTDDALATIRTRYRLTQRETEVARLLLEGRPNAEVAYALGISPHTARHHTERLLAKLGLESRNEIFYLVASRRSGEMRMPPKIPGGSPR